MILHKAATARDSLPFGISDPFLTFARIGNIPPDTGSGVDPDHSNGIRE